MARPIKLGMDYFPHDTDASGDEKVESLMMSHGPMGYTFYFILLERIYRTDNGELIISEAETRQLLARKMFITIQEFDNLLATALKKGCFDKEVYESRGALTSHGIKKRYETVNHKRLINRNKKDSATETKQKQVNNSSKTPERKVKESKVKESKSNRKLETDIPDDFIISDRVRKWAAEKGHLKLDEHLESFKLAVSAKGYRYTNWDSAFMRAVRDNWAKLKNTSTVKSQDAAGRELKYV